MILNGRHPVQVAHAKVAHGPLIAEHAPKVWIDYAGVGRVLFDIFKQERLPQIMPTTTTFDGQESPNVRSGHNVPKLSLLSRLQALMDARCLHMPDTQPLAKTSRRELLDFRVSHTAIGNATLGARVHTTTSSWRSRWRPAGQRPRDRHGAVAVREGMD